MYPIVYTFLIAYGISMLITKVYNDREDWWRAKWGNYIGYGTTMARAIEDCLADYRHVHYLKTGNILSVYSPMV